MKRKYLLVVVIIVLFQAIVPSFLYAKTNNEGAKQPEVCSGPSEMMSNYFNFQHEVISILLGSDLNERTLAVSFDISGLFSQKVLDLSAIDVIASDFITDVISSASNLLTSAVLVALVTSSVLESNIDIEGFAILFKDRPAVRDYKEMLEIETQMFDVAYFRSKEINLLRPVDGYVYEELYEIINKYVEKGLLEERNVNVTDISNASMVNMLSDLLSMNAAMKRFITVGGEKGKSALSGYNGCLGTFDTNNCDENNSILRFTHSAIEQLDNDYREVRSFSACNSYSNFFKNSIGNTIGSSKESLKTSVQDVKDSMNRLWGALVGNGRWDFRNNRSSLCEGISDYEMAQLRAYWGPNRTCGGRFNVSSSTVSDVSSFLSKAKNYFKEKISQWKQRQDPKNLENNLQSENSQNESKSQNGNLLKNIQLSASTKEKMLKWYEIFGSGTSYNPEFSVQLYSNFEDIYGDIIDEYGQSLVNATYSDTSDLFAKGKGILDQIESLIEKGGKLEEVLQKIVDKQCSG